MIYLISALVFLLLSLSILLHSHHLESVSSRRLFFSFAVLVLLLLGLLIFQYVLSSVLYIEQKIIRTGKLEDLTTEELEQRMKRIIDDYSPILDGVSEEELKAKVKEKPELISGKSK